jgi:hypothetical protein
MLHAAMGGCSAGLRMKGEVVAGQKHKPWFWVGMSAMAIAIVAAATFEILLSLAAPILRARLLQSLSARYHSRVELGSFDVSGATIKLAGTYSLDGAKFNFAGTADMQATVSRMVGGWRGVLLMPFDRVFQKNGAGTEVPFKIDGTRSDPHFGLDFDRLKKK